MWRPGECAVAVGAAYEYMGSTHSSGSVLEMSVVRGVRGVVCEMCMCLFRGGVGVVGRLGERVGFGIHQSCRNRSIVGRASVFGLRWYGWCCGGRGVCGLIKGLVGGDVMSVCGVSLDSLWKWQVQVSVYCGRRIPAHLMCTQRSIMLHLFDICFRTYICLWEILQIQTFLGVVVVHGLVFDITCFYGERFQPSSESAWPGGSTQFA